MEAFENKISKLNVKGYKLEITFYKNLFLYPDLVSTAIAKINLKNNDDIQYFFDNISMIKDKSEFELLIRTYDIDFSCETKIKKILDNFRVRCKHKSYNRNTQQANDCAKM
jgi:hypothetical protein